MCVNLIIRNLLYFRSGDEVFSNCDLVANQCLTSEWAGFGKQNWRCGINQTLR